MKTVLLAALAICLPAFADHTCDHQRVIQAAHALEAANRRFEDAVVANFNYLHLQGDISKLEGQIEFLDNAAHAGQDCARLRQYFSQLSTTARRLGQAHQSLQAQYPDPQIRQRWSYVTQSIRSLQQALQSGGSGGWYPVRGEDCYHACRSFGLLSGVSPEGAQCVSGENRAASAVGVVPFTYGCWPSHCPPDAYSNAASRGAYCYKPGQKMDNDRTDLTVGCFCR